MFDKSRAIIAINCDILYVWIGRIQNAVPLGDNAKPKVVKLLDISKVYRALLGKVMETIDEFLFLPSIIVVSSIKRKGIGNSRVYSYCRDSRP